jgi:two-component system NtrC family sensor kinase
MKQLNFVLEIVPGWPLVLVLIVLFTVAAILYGNWRSRKITVENKQLEEKAGHAMKQLQHKTAELIHTTESLRATQKQLIQSEKMASLGQLTAGIAHEIQNPLNFVNNFSELSVELINELETTEGDEKKIIVDDLKQNLEKIVFHGKRANSIVKGMLQHSRSSTAEKQLTDINKLVEEFFILAYHGMRAKDPGFNCKMEKNLAAGLPMVKIIPQDVSRVILNIFNNSFYAVDERRKLEGKDFKPVVMISTEQVDGKIVIRIRDNGRGIPDEIRDKIFNPFFTTKPTGQGTGLGLSISYDIIVKDHFGDMQIDTKAGEYTEFKITLPI